MFHCYLINRLLTVTLSCKQPFKVLFKTIQDYSFLKVFGCCCFPNLRPHSKHELTFHSSSCTFLGYSPYHKGYKCPTLDSKVLISRDVIFYETTFSFYIKLHSSLPFILSTAGSSGSIPTVSINNPFGHANTSSSSNPSLLNSCHNLDAPPVMFHSPHKI